MPMNPNDLEADQEVDVWWGSYAGRTMLPSFLVCLLLTGLIISLAWAYVDRGEVKLTVLGLGGAVWLVQLVRFAWRYFGFTYRLTSKRLFCGMGRRPLSVLLADIAEVRDEHNGLEKLVGVGRICLTFVDKMRPVVVLKGVKKPKQVAELIRSHCQQAKSKNPASL